MVQKLHTFDAKAKKKHSLSVSDLFQHLTVVSLSASELWEAEHFWDRSAFACWPETEDSPLPPSALIFWMILPGFCHSGLLICHFQSFSTGEKFTQLQNRSSQRYAAHSYRHTLCGISYTYQCDLISIHRYSHINCASSTLTFSYVWTETTFYNINAMTASKTLDKIFA